MGIGTPGSGGGMQAAPAGRCWGMGTRVLEFPMILFSAGNGNAGWQRDGVRDRALGGRGCGQGAQGSPNMQSPAAPKTRLPFEK